MAEANYLCMIVLGSLVSKYHGLLGCAKPRGFDIYGHCVWQLNCVEAARATYNGYPSDFGGKFYKNTCHKS